MFGWEALLSVWISSSPGTVLFGYPYGTSFRRVVDGVVAEYSPHNFYVQMLLRARNLPFRIEHAYGHDSLSARDPIGVRVSAHTRLGRGPIRLDLS
jgi:hypothetical protein